MINVNKSAMCSMRNLVLMAAIVIFPVITFANGFTQAEIDYQLCFTPQENCTALIVNAIDKAKNEIRVQAYSFTSAPIMRALLQAQKRGVDVKVLLDKSQVNATSYSSATFFTNSHIPVWIDYKPSIAHNKIMIIDGMTVITGSFNFTKAAQEKNAENLLIIKNNLIARKYLDNWNLRFSQTQSVSKTQLKYQERAARKSAKYRW
jgi:phosphatidylserine/phosphatidylglycerophosphate/cardiolipin synthase-like enzyme